MSEGSRINPPPNDDWWRAHSDWWGLESWGSLYRNKTLEDKIKAVLWVALLAYGPVAGGVLLLLREHSLTGWLLGPALLLIGALVIWCYPPTRSIVNEVKECMSTILFHRTVANKAYRRLSRPKESVPQEDLPPSGRYTGTHVKRGGRFERAYKLTFHTGGQIFGVVEDGARNLMIRGRMHKKVCYWCETLQAGQHASINNPQRCRDAILEDWPFHVEVVSRVVSAKKGKLQGKYYASRAGIGSIHLSFDDEEEQWSINVAEDTAESTCDPTNEAGPSSTTHGQQ